MESPDGSIKTMGGNALKSVSRIKQENVRPTIENIHRRLLPLLNLSKDEVAVLGSCGKKLPGSTSGDIDLALDKFALLRNNNLQDANLYDFLIEKIESLNCEYKYLKGLGIVTIAFPIANEDNKFVQLDLMPSNNLEMSVWGMFSPYEKDEPYKGAVRNELIYWIANELEYKDILGDGTLIERFIFEPLTGLVRLRQSYRGKTGNVLKSKYTVSRELIHTDPDTIVYLLFGPQYKPSDLLSTKATWDAFLSDSFPFKEARKRIVENTVKGLVKKGLEIPPYIQNYVS